MAHCIQKRDVWITFSKGFNEEYFYFLKITNFEDNSLLQDSHTYRCNNSCYWLGLVKYSYYNKYNGNWYI
jgi:hypothetical protein